MDRPVRQKTFLYVFKFFTTWCVLLALFHPYTHPYVNLLLLTFVTLIVGLYLSFVNPRRFVFYFGNARYEYTGLEKFIIVDMFFHVAVFYWIWKRYRGYYLEDANTGPTWVALFLLGTYCLLHPLQKIYGIPEREVLLVGCMSLVLYVLLFHAKSICA